MEIEDLTGLGKLADSKLVNKVYNHAVAETAKETGAIGRDIAKTFRLFLAPFQLAAAYQDRLERWLDRVRNAVPVERQIEAAPSVAGPAIQSLMFLEDDNPLVEMFLNLLTKAIDKDAAGMAHPAFVQILNQLSPDEAKIVAVLERDSWYAMPGHPSMERYEHDFPLDEIVFPHEFKMHCNHLRALGLLAQFNACQLNAKLVGPPELLDRPLNPKMAFQDVIMLTSFGHTFAAACLPIELCIKEETLHRRGMLSRFGWFDPYEYAGL